jgi:hypothetical protein
MRARKTNVNIYVWTLVSKVRKKLIVFGGGRQMVF